MSLKVSQLVWRAKLPSTQKLVAARLADFADDTGGRVFPSNRRVATECGLSERAVREAIRSLEHAGVLVLVALEVPGQRLPREYRFELTALAAQSLEAVAAAQKQEDHGEAHPVNTGASNAGGHVAPPLCTGAGDTGGQDVPPRGAPIAPDPLYNPPKELVVVGARPNAIAVEVLVPKPKAPHIVVGRRIDALTGWDQNPNWFGNYSLIIPWLSQGWDPDLDIVPTVERLMNDRNRRGQGPPRSLEYFQEAIANAYATRHREIPKGRIDAQRTVHSAGRSNESAHSALFAAAAVVDAQLRKAKSHA